MARKRRASKAVRAAPHFATTRWSLVLNAARGGSPDALAALGNLCEIYWYPLYAYVRRQGYQSAEAQDLTQSFFAHLLERGDLQNVLPERGRFRTYLLVALKHFLINEWRRNAARKRGGGRRMLSIDYAAGESRFSETPVAGRTPESDFDRQWALTLLDRVQSVLRDEQDDAERFEHLRCFLTGSDTVSYAEAAAKLHISEAAVKVAVHRLRRRFRDCLREQIAQTVETADEVDNEIRDLFEALRA